MERVLMNENEYYVNPFVLTFEEEDYIFSRPGMFLIQEDTLIVPESGMPLPPQLLTENRKSTDWTGCQRFAASSAVVNMDRLVRLNISIYAIHVFACLVLRLKESQSVYATLDMLMAKLEIKNKESLSDCLKELADNGVIANGPFVDTYWMNPLFARMGNRYESAWEYKG